MTGRAREREREREREGGGRKGEEHTPYTIEM
jgi:hypothetical protein